VALYVTGISTSEVHPEFPPLLGTLTRIGRPSFVPHCPADDIATSRRGVEVALKSRPMSSTLGLVSSRDGREGTGTRTVRCRSPSAGNGLARGGLGGFSQMMASVPPRKHGNELTYSRSPEPFDGVLRYLIDPFLWKFFVLRLELLLQAWQGVFERLLLRVQE
jgi:hypothetical protein